MSIRRFAKRILAANAFTSGIAGLAMISLPTLLAELLFTEPHQFHVFGVFLVGIGFVLFAIDLVMVAKDDFLTPKDLFLISVADDLWVLTSVAALLLVPTHFTAFGWYLVTGVAVGVAGFAVLQTLVGRKLDRPASRFHLKKAGRDIEIVVKRQTGVSTGTVWRVMNDHPGYADVADNLSKVEIIGGEGPNARRKCFGPKGESWTETCDLYREGEVFGFDVDTAAPDYPYPFKKVRGRWSVEQTASGAEFTIAIVVEPKTKIASWMMRMVGYRSIRALMINLAERWAGRMEREERDPAMRIAAQ